MKKLILASKSPRRRQILEKSGFNFLIANSDYEEELDSREFSYKKIETLAKNKAFGALPHTDKNSIILSADTVVVFDNQILTKPIDKNDAIETLKKLSNNKHSVVTSICLLDVSSKKYILNSTTTIVEFNYLTDELIEYYVTEFKPFDKAGSYGIQELPQGFLKSIQGNEENVIGLSSQSVKDTLKDLSLLLQENLEKYVYLQD